MQHDKAIRTFFCLLHNATGETRRLPKNVGPEVWQEVFGLARMHALIGIAYSAIEELPREEQPPKDLMLEWAVTTEYIKERNRKMDLATVAVSEKLLKDGFRSVILKGQGIARLYPRPEYRTAGDIDIWMEGSRERILAYLKQFTQKKAPVYHHADCILINGIHIEAHFTPSWMNEYFSNRRLQKFFSDNADEQFSHRIALADAKGSVCIPTLAFNRIYILIHIYRHFFQHGIGLRQCLDYCHILKQGFTEEEKKRTIHTLKRLRLMKFAGAVMYVMQIAFGLENEYLLVQPNEKEGKILLNEIMLAGNFGQFDRRIGKIDKKAPFRSFCRNVKRNLQFAGSYPAEALCSPLFKIWHYIWRKSKGWI